MYNETWFDRRGRYIVAAALTAVDWFNVAVIGIALGLGGLLAALIGALTGLRGAVVMASALASAGAVACGVVMLVAMVVVTPDHADPPPWALDEGEDV